MVILLGILNYFRHKYFGICPKTKKKSLHSETIMDNKLISYRTLYL